MTKDKSLIKTIEEFNESLMKEVTEVLSMPGTPYSSKQVLNVLDFWFQFSNKKKYPEVFLVEFIVALYGYKFYLEDRNHKPSKIVSNGIDDLFSKQREILEGSIRELLNNMPEKEKDFLLHRINLIKKNVEKYRKSDRYKNKSEMVKMNSAFASIFSAEDLMNQFASSKRHKLYKEDHLSTRNHVEKYLKSRIKAVKNDKDSSRNKLNK